jgi:phage shock protein A
MERDDAPDPQFDAMTARLLRREALRRAAEQLNTTSVPGLEDALARISAEVTADACYRINATAEAGHGHADAATTTPRPPGQHD